MGREGVCFRHSDGRKPFRVDPIPRLLAAEEWEALEAGLAQRAEALERFIRDAYSDQRIVASGALPERVISTAAHFDHRLRGLEVPGNAYVYVYGPDIVRDPHGELLVLEDNMRTPSGVAYLLAIHEAVGRELGSELGEVREPDPALGLLASALRLAAPGTDDPEVALLTDGKGSPAYYEHCELARRLDVALVTLDDVAAQGDELVRHDDRGVKRRIDVIYRRTDEASFTADDGGITPLAQNLRGPIEAGRLGVANAFGSGIGDDKLTHAYIDTMIRFYLDEEPLLRSVRTLDLGDSEQLAEALGRLDELVVKERHRAGGVGVMVEPEEEPEGVEGVRRKIEERGDGLVAQERVEISSHPTIVNGGFEPRRVDLRPFIFRAADGWKGIPGGLTRFAATSDSLVVNSTQGGGGKDTWVLT
jgi:uncharacterized circularly permuted ATP-grasp superfamily protein